jgi:hypothetical protein
MWASVRQPCWRSSAVLPAMSFPLSSVCSAHEDAGASGGFRYYSLYGISLKSEIPLTYPEHRGDCVPDVTFSLKTERWFSQVRAGIPESDLSNEWWYSHARRPDGSVYIRWDDLFEFVVSADGREVTCGRLENATPESFQNYLLGPVLSFALVKQGHEPLHATVVVVDGKGVAFFGTCGDGKSTLAASFLHAGHQILTDDLLLIGDIDAVPCGFPGPARIKLFPEVAERFQPLDRGRTPMNPHTEKLIVPLAGGEIHDGPVPMHGFFVLDAPATGMPGVSVSPLSASESLLAIVGATFNTRVRSADRLKRQFLAAEQWSARMPVRRLTYPRTLAVLDQVREVIVEEVRSARRTVGRRPSQAISAGEEITLRPADRNSRSLRLQADLAESG